MRESGDSGWQALKGRGESAWQFTTRFGVRISGHLQILERAANAVFEHVAVTKMARTVAVPAVVITDRQLNIVCGPAL